MDTTVLITFLVVSAGLIVVPGPNVLVIVASSVSHGRIRGLQTVAGTTLAMALQLFFTAVSTGWLVHAMNQGLSLLKWSGVIYLLCLGLLYLVRAGRGRQPAPVMSASGTFFRGFAVSISNPKTMLFFAAFLPQFATTGEMYMQQIAILSLIFLCLAALLDSCYAILASGLYPVLQRFNISRIQNGLSGILLLCASVWLATARRVT